jgi:type IV pilus assembly protein PilW
MHPTLHKQRGFTMAELMVAVGIGLVILAAMTSLFVNNSRTQSEIEKSNRQIENGRYAIQVTSGDLRNAGFFGEYDPSDLTLPAALPDICSTVLATVESGINLHVQGINDVATATAPSCLTDIKTGTDTIVVRRAATCVAGDDDCDPASAGGPYFQASLCDSATQLGSGTGTDHYDLAIATASLGRLARNCTAAASIRRYVQNVYFIANNNNSGDGIPTLKRLEISSDGTAISHSVMPLVEGVENLQLEYGLDTSNPTDGVADVFTNDPGPHTCAAACTAPENWHKVVSVRVNLLARNLEKSSGYSESKTFVLGNLTDGTENTVTAGSDGYKRHVFQTLVGLSNPAGRKMP